MLPPLKFRPILKERVWGGRRLVGQLHKPGPPGVAVGESWEICDRRGENSVVAEGPFAEKALHDVIRGRHDEVYGDGPGPLPSGRFPLLVKFIDAAERVSVQVHPDDDWAAKRRLADGGKTECWYFLDAPRDGLLLGLADGLAPERFAKELAAGHVETCLKRVHVAAGDLVFCPAGVVHAILPPALLVEIQQNSDVTFRLHDWGRPGPDGQPRPLHVEDALSAVRSPTVELRPRPVRVASSPFEWDQLLKCDRFTVNRWRLTRTADIGSRPNEFEVLVCVAGRGFLAADRSTRIVLAVGDAMLVPACARNYTLTPEPALTLLHVTGRP
jgi:mannose-6-phosphate isomerase